MSEKRILIPREDIWTNPDEDEYSRVLNNYTRPITPEDKRKCARMVDEWPDSDNMEFARRVSEYQFGKIDSDALAQYALDIALRPAPEEDKPREVAAERFLAENYSKIRAAACNLAAAALHVIQEYDGVHRMALALSEFTKALANEGGRDHRKEDK